MRNELDLWRGPGRELFGLSRRLNRLFDDWFSEEPSSFGTDLTVNSPACDLEETDSHYLMCIDMPGISKKDINVEVVGDQIHVSGERKQETTEGKGKRRSLERSYGRFERVFTLPAGIDTNKIEAEYKDGVLELAVPKGEAVKPKRVEIKEGGQLISRLTGSKEKAEKANEIPVSEKKEKAA